MVTGKPTLTFVSTRFLFPTDSGGKIRTTQILRGLKGGKLRIRLVMSCEQGQVQQFAHEIESLCDELVTWEVAEPPALWKLLRKASWITRAEPIPVISDWSREGSGVVAEELDRKPDVVVFDFPHSAILAPASINRPSVMFTHNIEAEIFKRHLDVAKSPFHRWLWRNQYRKMVRYESAVLKMFDTSIAVSARDCNFFREHYQIDNCEAIPTGVDLEFFNFKPPVNPCQVVFCGSMDWLANVDGVEYFHRQVWPLVISQLPNARMKVVGRSPPSTLVKDICSASPEWEFTGFVDDVRKHVHESAAFVIPLRVGGGTRIKAFEAMAMGSPVVSTSIGIEGLPVEHGEHFLCADRPAEMADSIVSLLRDSGERHRIAGNARQLVEENHGFRGVARVFERICLDTIESAQLRVGSQATGAGRVE